MLLPKRTRGKSNKSNTDTATKNNVRYISEKRYIEGRRLQELSGKRQSEIQEEKKTGNSNDKSQIINQRAENDERDR